MGLIWHKTDKMGTITPRTFTIDYSIEDVKKTIKKIVDSKNFTLRTSNEMFGTYELDSMDFLKFISITLQLTKKTEAQTEIIISSATDTNGGSDISITTRMDKLSSLISKSLHGEEIPSAIPKPVSPKANVFGAILLIIFIIALFFIFVRCKPNIVSPPKSAIIQTDSFKTIIYDAIVPDSLTGGYQGFLTGFQFTLPNGQQKDSIIFPVNGTKVKGHCWFTYQIKSGTLISFIANGESCYQIFETISCNGKVIAKETVDLNHPAYPNPLSVLIPN